LIEPKADGNTIGQTVGFIQHTGELWDRQQLQCAFCGFGQVGSIIINIIIIIIIIIIIKQRDIICDFAILRIRPPPEPAQPDSEDGDIDDLEAAPSRIFFSRRGENHLHNEEST